MLFKAVFLALVIRVCLKITSFKTIIKFLNFFSKGKYVLKNETNELKRFSVLMDYTYHLHPIINCLAITTTFWFFLKRRGIKTDLKFGMLKDQKKLKAHAWLEHDGIALSLDKTIAKYTAFSKSIL